ncbi:MAG: U32 family peptidase [Betaproteobacteria bacterium]
MALKEPAITDRFSLVVGPVLTYWPRQRLLDFYDAVAASAADTVVLGEVVCSRRHEMKPDDWLAIGRELRAAGKRVRLASQALLESESDLRGVRRLAEQDEFAVEAGDVAAVHRLAARRVPFVIGPHVNVYSRPALEEYARFGAAHWVAPAELSIDTVAHVNPAADPVRGADGAPVPTEVYAFGRLPLAFSARCFTARHHRLSKDSCEFRCIEDPDGLLLASSEGQPFLVLNGTQTQSAAQHCLVGDRPALAAAGVSALRLSPCAERFAEVIDVFDAVMNRGADVREGERALHALALPGGLANGFAHARPGLEWAGA